jgi:hypothetical protein
MPTPSRRRCGARARVATDGRFELFKSTQMFDGGCTAGSTGSVFPRDQLRRIIDGTGIASHGTREMPVWGDGFRSAREGLTPDAARARIDAVVAYLESIQEQPAE